MFNKYNLTTSTSQPLIKVLQSILKTLSDYGEQQLTHEEMIS